jgi:GNAT superfamily N-acetyltransferase
VGEHAIREAGAEDAGAIAALAARAWRAAYAGLLPAALLDGLDSPARAAEWRAYLDEMPSADRVWVAVADGPVCGFARTGPCADGDLPAGAGEVHGLYVEPGRIGTGIGRRLFRHAMADLGSRGLRPVVVWHFADNRRAGRFYDAAGVTLDGARRRSEYGVDEVRRRAPG